jgi:hypothetical protein
MPSPMTRRPARFYPFLLAVVPVLHMAANNPGWSTVDDLAAISVTLLAGCGIVYGLAALVSRGRWGGRLPPLVVLGAVLWFWGYVTVVDLVGRRGNVATHLVVFPLGIAATLGLGWWLLRRPSVLDRVATFLTLTGGLLVGWSALSIGVAHLRSARALRQSAVVRRLAEPIPVRPGAAAGPKRDIYLIVLDEYANAETTTARFGFDNHAFLDSLRQLGFVVPAVHSNYLHTALSLPSLLNASQLTDLSRELGSQAKDVTVLHYLVENNRAVAFLKGLGYRFVFFPSQWWIATRHNRHADSEVDVWSGWHPLRELSRSHLRRTLRKTSMLDLLQREAAWNIYGDHDSRVFTAIAQVPKTPGPVFVFAHVMTPHLPFVFDRECRPLNRKTAGTVSKGKLLPYVEQVECLNRMVLRLVTLLLEADVPPVILLQSDHGTKTLRFGKAPTAEAIPVAAARERLGAFGAYYLPDHGAEAFGDSVTLVNVLGDVLRYYLGAKLPREPDDMYLSLGRAPFAFKRVDPAWLTQTDSSEGRPRSAGAGPASVAR